MNKVLLNTCSIALIASIAVYLTSLVVISHYFEKKAEYRSFEECLAVTSDPSTAWDTRRDTTTHCWEQRL